jgi:DNA-binding LacI/PurR family transcriptional regulator
MRNKITSHDVAQLAGVSQSTVSRALRGEPGPSDATRERVRHAAATLDYVPIESGRSLSTRSTRRIGIVAADLTNPFYPELVEPARVELHRLGYRTLLIPDLTDPPADIERLVDGSLDGVMLTTTALGSPLPHALLSRGVPFVLVNREVDDIPADICVVDNRAGARQVAHLLAQLGHRHVGAVFGPSDTSTGRDREAGFRTGLAEREIELRPPNVRRGPFAYRTGHEATTELLGQPHPPTAIFCGNDVIALGACNAAARLGLQPGADVTIAGFDDIAMAAWDLFGLTTVRCDRPEMTRVAVDLLVQRIGEPDRPTQRIVLQPDVVLRSTHGPPPNPPSSSARIRA